MENNQLIESIEPTLIKVEQFRKKQLRLKKMEYGFYALGSILFLVMLFTWSVYGFLLTGGLIVAFVILVIARLSMIGTPKKEYQEVYNKEVTKRIIQTLNSAIKYVSNNYKYQINIRNSGLLGTSGFSENNSIVLEGKTKNAYPFQLMEVSLVGQEMLAGNQSQATYKGMVCIINGAHYLGEHTIIKPKKGWTESSMTMYTTTGNEEHLTLFSTQHKSLAFNEKYVVYTKQRKEVEHLLTGEALQQIDALIQAQKVPVTIVLKEHQLFLFLPGINHFEANLQESLLGGNVVKRTYNKIKATLDLVEDLSLLIGGEAGRMKIIMKENIKPLDNATDSAYDHFIED